MPQKRTSEVTGGAKATIDHDEIRTWVESHGGKPAIVKRTRQQAKGPGILRVDFPGFSGERTLEHVSWDEWFDRFEQSELAFLYQDRTGSGRPSRFNKLVGRETVEVSPQGRAERAVKKAVPRRWAKKGARTRRELAEREAATGARKGAQPTKRRTAPTAKKRAAVAPKRRAAAGPKRRASAAPTRRGSTTSKRSATRTTRRGRAS